MAITFADYELFQLLRDAGHLPPNPSVLELGESNWYGDVPLQRLADDCERLRPELLPQLLMAQRLGLTDLNAAVFEVARVFWGLMFGEHHRLAVDLHGTANAARWDLNEPLDLPAGFHAVINLGTAEHIYNQRQFFQTAHDACRPGGLMVHALPFTGWFQHGFYNYQPTFIADIAAANGYEILAWLYGDHTNRVSHRLCGPGDEPHTWTQKGFDSFNDTMHHVAFRKVVDGPFNVPMQGLYAQARISAAENDRWRGYRRVSQ